MARKFSKVYVHQALFATGKNIGNFLPPNDKTLPGLEMTETEYGISVKFDGDKEFLVPWANIVNALYVPEPKKLAVKKE